MGIVVYSDGNASCVRGRACETDERASALSYSDQLPPEAIMAQPQGARQFAKLRRWVFRQGHGSRSSWALRARLVPHKTHSSQSFSELKAWNNA